MYHRSARGRCAASIVVAVATLLPSSPAHAQPQRRVATVFFVGDRSADDRDVRDDVTRKLGPALYAAVKRKRPFGGEPA